ncbi:MAG: hypothetical protein LBH13_09455 [Cellulomonadaceae bacterium]|nr:hypothetical protein [Cellulomonadaceae bacterium]
MLDVEVNHRVFENHPEMIQEDIEYAMEAGALQSQVRLGSDPECYVGAGTTSNGKLVQWIGIRTSPQGWYVYHAMELTEKVRRELGMRR